jgi:hypothetical protein
VSIFGPSRSGTWRSSCRWSNARSAQALLNSSAYFGLCSPWIRRQKSMLTETFVLLRFICRPMHHTDSNGLLPHRRWIHRRSVRSMAFHPYGPYLASLRIAWVPVVRCPYGAAAYSISYARSESWSASIHSIVLAGPKRTDHHQIVPNYTDLLLLC